MPILLVLVALFVPRLVIALLWFFTGWFTGVFPHWAYGIAGFLFLPYTTLWYSAVQNWYDGQWGTLQFIVLAVAFVADLGLFGGAKNRRAADAS